jgi:O-phospho-L-seryl-tRNASec:L-selenocysteinyl-tRNA synthase
VENAMSAEGELCTDVEEVRAQLSLLGDQVLCVLCTTSCFAPRQPDLLDKVAVLCKEFDVGHVVNNAYGLQCASICKLINRAARVGTVTAVVQSTDKNFLVPVGGAVVFSPSAAFVDLVSASYPGRASAAPILDLFITLLSMGEEGYRALLRERERLCGVVQAGLLEITAKHSLSLLPAPRNSISTALSLQSLLQGEASAPASASAEAEAAQAQVPDMGQPATVTFTTSALWTTSSPGRQVTFLGSMLFQRCVSGCRVVECKGEVKKVAGHDFCDWGAHKSLYPHSYLTVACAVGMTEEDAVLFLTRLDKSLLQFKKKGAARPATIPTIPTVALAPEAAEAAEAAEAPENA